MLPGIVGLAGIGGATISYQGIATAAATSVALPTHQAGDFIIILAERGLGSTIPDLPAGWTNIHDGTDSFDNTWSWRVGYKVAASASELSGTWTNATRIAAAVYRGVSGIGANSETVAGTTTPTWNGLTLQNGNGSWIIGLLSHEHSSTATSVPFTTRDNVNGRTWWDTNGPIFSFTTVNASLANGNRGTATIVIELVN